MIQKRHITVVEMMAQGLQEMKEAAAAKNFSLYDVEGRIQYFLDRLYLMRISIRLLIHQHCELSYTGWPEKWYEILVIWYTGEGLFYSSLPVES